MQNLVESPSSILQEVVQRLSLEDVPILIAVLHFYPQSLILARDVAEDKGDVHVPNESSIPLQIPARALNSGIVAPKDCHSKDVTNSDEVAWVLIE